MRYKILKVFTLILISGYFQSCVITKPTISFKKSYQLDIDTFQIFKDVTSLTSISPPRNNRNMKSLNKAYDFIYGEFSKLDYKLETQKYKANHRTFKNLIATYNEEKGNRLIIGAHYDVCEDTPGADDNASGVAALLALARLVDSLKPPLDFRLDLIAYSTEEPPYNGIPMGSQVHAKSLADDSVDIQLMISLDMLGYYSFEKNSQYYPINFFKFLYPNKADFALIVTKFGQGRHGKKLKKKMKQVCNMKLRSVNAPDKGKTLSSSDHGSYWVFGYNALVITDTSYLRNDNYHETTDTPETLNYKYIGEIVKGLYWYLVN